MDTGFFTALATRFPDLIDHAEILPKGMKATNELSCYLSCTQGAKVQPWKRNNLSMMSVKMDRSILQLPKWIGHHCSRCSKALQLTGFRVEISWARQRSQGQFEHHFPSYPAGQCHCSNHVPISDWPSDARIWNVYQSAIRTQALRTIRGPAPQASSRSVAFIYGSKGRQYTRTDASERERKNRSARTCQEHPRADGCQSHGTQSAPGMIPNAWCAKCLRTS